ncbi:MAG TPA: hypothetical protein VL527_06685, partial [Dongiaceae bacterium]|nr:hypothetical protein [Dongiaceae bacterium]
PNPTAGAVGYYRTLLRSFTRDARTSRPRSGKVRDLQRRPSENNEIQANQTGSNHFYDIYPTSVW